MKKEKFVNVAKARLMARGFKGKRSWHVMAKWCDPSIDVTTMTKGELRRVVCAYLGNEPRPSVRDKPKGESEIAGFYKTWEWKRLAYECKLRDGRKCMCCNATAAEHGVRIVSDHIKPIRTHWHLRLDASNIQTLCDDCNRGKGSHDSTDFR